jgi:hypothetical protein
MKASWRDAISHRQNCHIPRIRSVTYRADVSVYICICAGPSMFSRFTSFVDGPNLKHPFHLLFRSLPAQVLPLNTARFSSSWSDANSQGFDWLHACSHWPFSAIGYISVQSARPHEQLRQSVTRRPKCITWLEHNIHQSRTSKMILAAAAAGTPQNCHVPLDRTERIFAKIRSHSHDQTYFLYVTWSASAASNAADIVF